MTIQLGDGPTLPGGEVARSSRILLPSILVQPSIEGTGEKGKALAVYYLMQTHVQQGRKELVWDEKLAVIAQNKNMRQAHEGWAGHVSPQGYGMNWMARMAGYRLPDWYGTEDGANNIESLGRGGNGTVEQMWPTWLNSPGHAAHVLGLHPFFQEQTHVGVGYYHLEDSISKYYWCVLTAPPEEP